MRLSYYCIQVLKEKPTEAKVISHALMFRAGMIKQLASRTYTWLPSSLRVIRNVENIVRKHMNEAGCVEIQIPCMQFAEFWENGRYGSYGKQTMRFDDGHDDEMILDPSAEQVVSDIVHETFQSYRDLPTIFHDNEIRLRFDVVRGRQFRIKDAYYCNIDIDHAIETYNAMYIEYVKLFREMGVFVIPINADNGVIGGDLSHAFHILVYIGESAIYYDHRSDVIA